MIPVGIPLTLQRNIWVGRTPWRDVSDTLVGNCVEWYGRQVFGEGACAALGTPDTASAKNPGPVPVRSIPPCDFLLPPLYVNVIPGPAMAGVPLEPS